jgi:hypothetical protein
VGGPRDEVQVAAVDSFDRNLAALVEPGFFREADSDSWESIVVGAVFFVANFVRSWIE